MRHASLAIALISGTLCTRLAVAQSVQFRIIERTGQTQILSAADAVLDFAIQARVVGGSPTDFLGNFSFDIVAPGEADANGTLAKLLISNANGTYNANPANTVNGTTGRGGIARPYSYLAGISPNFNGLINVSAGTFTNDPAIQQIGFVTGSPTGQALLDVTDLDFDGNPDGFTGTTANVPASIGNIYFGANDNFVDVYRFKYTVTNLNNRTITFTLARLSAQIGTGLVFSNGVWGPVQGNAPSSVSGISFSTIPNPGVVATLGVAAIAAGARRRRFS